MMSRISQHVYQKFTCGLQTVLRLNTIRTKFDWTPEHGKLFNDIKNRISEDTILAIPDPKYPFHVHVDASLIGVGSILVQEFSKGKGIVSFTSRIYTKEE